MSRPRSALTTLPILGREFGDISRQLGIAEAVVRNRASPAVRQLIVGLDPDQLHNTPDGAV